MSLEANSTKIAELKTKINALPAAGLDTSDATAAAADIISGKTAYAGGEKITGSLEKITSLSAAIASKSIVQGGARFIGKTSKAAAIDSGKNVMLTMTAADLGDAAAADVAKGKTFTSENGFKLTGTHEEAAAPSGSISITANGTYDVADKASAVVNVPTSGGSIAGVTDLGEISFVFEELTSGDGTQYVEYMNSVGFTAPDEWYLEPYKFILPFEVNYQSGNLTELGTLEVWNYFDISTASPMFYGTMSIADNVFVLMPWALFSEPSADCPNLIDIATDESGGYIIDFTMGKDMLSSLYLVNSEGVSTEYLTDQLTNVHPILITYAGYEE